VVCLSPTLPGLTNGVRLWQSYICLSNHFEDRVSVYLCSYMTFWDETVSIYAIKFGDASVREITHFSYKTL